MVKYDVLIELPVQKLGINNPVDIVLPRESTIGFDGRRLYCRDRFQNWRILCSPRAMLAVWLEKGQIRKQDDKPTKAAQKIYDSFKAFQQKAKS